MADITSKRGKMPSKEVVEKHLADIMVKGMLPKDALKVSNQVMEFVYADAYHYYKAGQYEKAGHLFQALIMMNPSEPKYFLGLAGSYHLMKSYTPAVYAYLMAQKADLRNPLPSYHASDCYMKLNQPENARSQLIMALEICGDKPRHRALKTRIQSMLGNLNAQRKQQQVA